MRFIRFFAAIAAIAFLATPTAAQSGQCSFGMQMCGTPRTGGGCFNPAYATCSEGIVCSTGMIGCAPGAYGKGGCIRPNYSYCTQGLICETGMVVCAPGAKGRGGCFRPNYASCDNGNIHSR